MWLVINKFGVEATIYYSSGRNNKENGAVHQFMAFPYAVENESTDLGGEKTMMMMSSYFLQLNIILTINSWKALWIMIQAFIDCL